MDLDQTLLKQSALSLREKLEEYADNEEAAELAAALETLLDQAIQGELTETVEWEDVPGDIMFEEGGLRDLEGLEEAYATFKVEVTGENEFEDELFEDEEES